MAFFGFRNPRSRRTSIVKYADTPLPRVFAVSVHDVDIDKFQDSMDAGFSWYVFNTTLLASLSAFNIGWIFGVGNINKHSICQFNSIQNKHSKHRIGGEFPNQIPFTEHSWAIALIVMTIGGFLGALFSGIISDNIGRRNTLVINNGLFIAGSILLGTSTTWVHFTLGRLASGVGCGIASSVIITYVGEISPIKWRGFFGSFFQTFIAIGIICAQGVSRVLDESFEWRILVALPGVISIVQIILLPWRVESPCYLIKAHHVNEARHALLKLRRGYDVTREWQECLNSLEEDPAPGYKRVSDLVDKLGEKSIKSPTTRSIVSSNASTSNNSSRSATSNNNNNNNNSNLTMNSANKDMLNGPKLASIWQVMSGKTRNDLRHLIACSTVLLALQQLTSINGILFNTDGLLLRLFDPTELLGVKWICIGSAGVAIPGSLLCMCLVDRLGRRPMLLCGLAGMVVCSILVTVGVFLGLYPMVVASLFIYHFMFNMGIGNIPWFYIAECTPKYAVGATAVLACSINWAIAVIFTLLTPVVENYIPLFSLLIFGVFALLGLVFVVLCVPETMKLRAIDVVRMHCGGFHLAIRRGRL